MVIFFHEKYCLGILGSTELLNMSSTEYLKAITFLEHKVESKSRRNYIHILVDAKQYLVPTFHAICGQSLGLTTLDVTSFCKYSYCKQKLKSISIYPAF